MMHIYQKKIVVDSPLGSMPCLVTRSWPDNIGRYVFHGVEWGLQPV